ncbi:molybdopterin-binding/glycosyltransferase family 2 protein [Rhodobacteraceae bacterium NNCM2]|nr:molybdopterin-binding/glycosyltransferase family 2 protein [Coraliihabitans acroporae]
MKFGPVPLADAQGAVLAHSLKLGKRVFKKGRVLSAADIAEMAAESVEQVTAARLGPEDVPEDAAAARIAALLMAEGIAISAPFTGRANLFADQAGLVAVDTDLVHRLNRLHESITVATLEPLTRVHARQMLATVKIIPYAAPEAAVAEAEALLAEAAREGRHLLTAHPFTCRTASLILTRTPGMADRIVEKGARVVRDRIAALGMTLAGEAVVPHEAGAIAAALDGAVGEVVLILTGSATSDRLDAGPAGLVAAGGNLARFGMPVDPGNLLFLGDLAGRPVVGLPGCARSPKLNGADWVLERLVAGLSVGDDEISAMGVGGLLKEIPSRPNPRTGGAEVARRPVIAAIILAAGQSRRMEGRDKLMEPVGGEPLLRRVAAAAGQSAADRTLVVLREDDPRRDVLADMDVTIVANPRAGEGMGTSLAAGIRALDPSVDGALILMADMPEITSAHIDRVIAGFDPGEGRAIIRATAADGRPGHPVLFGRRFFEPLSALAGDQGARDVVREHDDFVTDLALTGEAAVVDLDTPDAWAAWRSTAGKPALQG